jgi:hypothetical protein
MRLHAFETWIARRKQVLAALLLFFLTSPASGQTSPVIKGIVRDQNGALEFVNVILREAADTSKVVSIAVTDSLGQFTFSDFPKGAYILNLHALGFVNKLVTVSLNGVDNDLGIVYLVAGC